MVGSKIDWLIDLSESAVVISCGDPVSCDDSAGEIQLGLRVKELFMGEVTENTTILIK